MHRHGESILGKDDYWTDDLRSMQLFDTVESAETRIRMLAKTTAMGMEKSPSIFRLSLGVGKDFIKTFKEGELD